MRTARYAVIPAVAGSLLLAGCGGNSSDSASTTSSTSGSVATSAAGSTGTAAAACPTDNTRAFAKTRFVADVGLAAGSFHRYIYKPYKAGKFNKGANGRTAAMVKAGITAAADAKLISNAAENAKANPTLCKTVAQPLSQLSTSLGGLKGAIASGNLAAIGSTEALVQKVLSGAKSSGVDIVEKSN